MKQVYTLIGLFLLVFPWTIKAERLVRPVSISGRYYVMDNSDIVDTLYNLNGVDYIYIFKSLNDASFETMQNEYAIWTEQPTNISSAQTNVFQNVTDGYCYVVTIGDKTETFVFIDYSLHRFDQTKITAIDLDCKETTIHYDPTMALTYYTPSGEQKELPYKLAVKYNNQQWDSVAIEWKQVEVVDTILITTAGAATIGPNLMDTKFTFEESEISTVLNNGLSTIYTDDSTYTAVAVQHRMQYYITKRGKAIENEIEGPYGVGHLSSEAVHSAPLNVLFEAHPSAKADVYYWTIKEGTDLITQRNDKNMRYIFDEVSDNSSSYYDVDLKITNSEHTACYDTAHIQFKLNSSYIKVPNVFTPNGDGMNDEFRVAYKSICDFHCWVYNRWQHLVYQWDDPTKGWDGTYNGRKEPDSAFIYIIEATGCDGQKYKLKGTVNLLRGK